jgi:hypothetical protein
MVDFTGPISTPPGSRHKVPTGTRCYNHPDRFAKFRIQGETHSLGAQMNDYCAECYNELRKEAKELEVATVTCDRCGKEVTTLANHRDFEEGYMCKSCRDKERQEILAAMRSGPLDGWDE